MPSEEEWIGRWAQTPGRSHIITINSSGPEVTPLAEVLRDAEERQKRGQSRRLLSCISNVGRRHRTVDGGPGSTIPRSCRDRTSHKQILHVSEENRWDDQIRWTTLCGARWRAAEY